jgi:hypothetical protein
MHSLRILALMVVVTLLAVCTLGADPPASKPVPGSSSKSSKPKTTKSKPPPKKGRSKPPPKKAASLPKKAKHSSGRAGGGRTARTTGPKPPTSPARTPGTPKSAKAVRAGRMAGSIRKSSAGRASASLAAMKRSIEWELAASVVQGTVRSLQRIDPKGKVGSQGSRFVVTMDVDRVLKGASIKSGDTLRLEGWATGSKRQHYLPPASESVWAFLKKSPSGRHDLLVPSGFRNTRPEKMKSSGGQLPEDSR